MHQAEVKNFESTYAEVETEFAELSEKLENLKNKLEVAEGRREDLELRLRECRDDDTITELDRLNDELCEVHITKQNLNREKLELNQKLEHSTTELQTIQRRRFLGTDETFLHNFKPFWRAFYSFQILIKKF